MRQIKTRLIAGATLVAGAIALSVANPSPTTAQNKPVTQVEVVAPSHDVNNPAYQPVTIDFNETMPPGAPQTNCPITVYTVPSGKRLVIEYVNFLGLGPNTPLESVTFQITFGFASVSYTFLLERRGEGQSGSQLYGYSETTRIYFGPGENVNLWRRPRHGDGRLHGSAGEAVGPPRGYPVIAHVERFLRPI